MATTYKIKDAYEKVQVKIKEFVFISFGLLLYAIAWKAFLLPHQITGGGVTGVGALVYYASGLPISITFFSIDRKSVV